MWKRAREGSFFIDYLKITLRNVTILVKLKNIFKYCNELYTKINYPC